ncbi:MAG: hypothetical protein ACK2UO_02855 [Caldilineaceae bacterium]|jgi:hypothetical protein
MAKPPPPPARAQQPVEAPANANAANGKGAAPAPVAVVHNLKKPESGDLKPLNFKVDPEFHRQFKSYAASHGISMLELLREGFELVKEHRGNV